MTSPSLEAINLTKKYGSFTALSKLNLKLEGSKCVGFLGPNGAGKTTTLKIFTDMIRPTGGMALINGIDVNKEKKKALKSVGVLIETPEIYGSLSAREALSMIAEIKGIPRASVRKSVEDVSELVKMKGLLNQKIKKMSKGMKQRINIAAAILGNPEIVILDEPTSGLDPRGMSEVRDIIKDLKKENRLIFMSSHLLSEVSEICDDVAMINHGKLLAYGPIEKIVEKFSKVGAVEVEVNLFRPVTGDTIDRLRNIKGVRSVKKVDSKTVLLQVIGGLKGQEEVLSRLVRIKLGIVGFKQSSSALEETYLSMFKETV